MQAVAHFNFAWQIQQGQNDHNPCCDIFQRGDLIFPSSAGWALASDSGVKCTLLVAEVFNLFLVEMKLEGFIAEQLNSWYPSVHNNSCPAGGAGAKEFSCTFKPSHDVSDTDSLGISHFQGVFIILAVTIVASTLWAAVSKRRALLQRNSGAVVEASRGGEDADGLKMEGGDADKGTSSATKSPRNSSDGAKGQRGLVRRIGKMEGRMESLETSVQELHSGVQQILLELRAAKTTSAGRTPSAFPARLSKELSDGFPSLWPMSPAPPPPQDAVLSDPSSSKAVVMSITPTHVAHTLPHYTAWLGGEQEEGGEGGAGGSFIRIQRPRHEEEAKLTNFSKRTKRSASADSASRKRAESTTTK